MKNKLQENSAKSCTGESKSSQEKDGIVARSVTRLRIRSGKWSRGLHRASSRQEPAPTAGLMTPGPPHAHLLSLY